MVRPWRCPTEACLATPEELPPNIPCSASASGALHGELIVNLNHGKVPHVRMPLSKHTTSTNILVNVSNNQHDGLARYTNEQYGKTRMVFSRWVVPFLLMPRHVETISTKRYHPC